MDSEHALHTAVADRATSISLPQRARQRLPESLVEVLDQHAATSGNKVGLRFLQNTDGTTVELTFAQISAQSRALAARLSLLAAPGERAMLLYPPGLDYVIAMLACWRCGLIAVPAYPPHRNRHALRVAAIAANCQPALLLTTAELAQAVSRRVAAGDYGTAEVVVTNGDLSTAGVIENRTPRDQVALLQYTSGSTGTPKGVVISHSNLLSNTASIAKAFSLTSSSHTVFWLPMYHDMGLVGGIAETLLLGSTVTMLAPNHFLQRPIDWLRCISDLRADTAGGPNFAFDLCVARTTPEERASLDLSCWRVAFCGAEPVRAATFDRFCRAFEVSGFERRSFYPCYGLAEATLLVASCGGDAANIQRPAGVPRRIVSCGRPVGVERLAIVDPQTGRRVAEGQTGEIWVSGPGIAIGYWLRPQETETTFGAMLAEDRRRYLRTGDLGYLSESELFVTGRLKEVLVIRGVKHHPHDIEHSAVNADARLSGSLAVAFTIEASRGEELVVAVEANGRHIEDSAELVAQISSAITSGHDISPRAVLLLRPGQLSRTSSGKIQRFACREAYIAKRWQPLAEWRRPRRPAEAVQSPADSLDAAIAVLQQVAGFAVDEVSRATPLAAMNIDSLQVMEMVARMERHSGRRINEQQIAEISTVGDIADLITEHPVAKQQATTSTDATCEGRPFAQWPEYRSLQDSLARVTATDLPNPFFEPHDGIATDRTSIAGREYINFCSYNYLGLSGHPAVSAAAQQAIAQYGTSVSASRLVSGERPLHRLLESGIAQLLGTDDAITFVGGHSTNETVIGHLFGPGDLVLHDAYAHNSIVQGCRLSGAQRSAFAHNDFGGCRQLLAQMRHEYRRVLIAVEGVYSMDGDICPLPEFVSLRNEFRALLMVDEAHSLGTLGATGLGAREHFGLAAGDVDLWMGTLSKALASCGGYIAAEHSIVEYLRYTAPGFVYSVGLSPPNAAAALAAIQQLVATPELVSRLRDNAARFLSAARAAGLDCGPSAGTPIVPIITGSSVAALHLAHRMKQSGVNVQPILAPAVEESAARLRFFITAQHTVEQIDRTVELLAQHSRDLPRA